MKAFIAAAVAFTFVASASNVLARPQPAPVADSGILRVKSAYPVAETVERIKVDVAAKKIVFFSVIDQGHLASGAGINLRPSMLLTFGNPPLGLQFLTANPYAALDWPVRMIVFQDEDGTVWVAYTDFAYIARRHHLVGREAPLKMASEVAASIASSVVSR